MRIFVYEFVCGGGWYGVEPSAPSGSLLAEGSAMLQSSLLDLASLDKHEITTTLDSRLSKSVAIPEGLQVVEVTSAADERAVFEREIRASDAAWIIAPEFDDHLLSRAAAAEKQGVTLLQPGSEFTRIAGDKWETYERFLHFGVPTPRTCLSLSGDEIAPPLVTKPRFGCGSLDVLLHSQRPELPPSSNSLVQEFVPGTAASIAVIAGPRGSHYCPAALQHLSDDVRFTYLGGELPLDEEFQRRAERLASLVVNAMPPAQGYFGIDLVMGSTESDDRVIEVNPRLTTSYVGLRRLFRGNLAEAMLACALGADYEFAWHERRVRFTAGGECSFIDE